MQTIYSQAAKAIQRHGWCQGTPQDSEGRMCLVGAIISVADVHEVFVAYEEIRFHLGILNPVVWNDRPERTVEDVMLLLKELDAQSGGCGW